MKYALISTEEFPVKYISEYIVKEDGEIEGVITNIEHSCRVAQVKDQKFDVANTLFWVECDNNVIADKFYYNTNDNNIYPIPEGPIYPE